MILPEVLFRALADTTRLRCLNLLVHHGELCVCDLTQILALSQPKISRHLANLKASQLVKDRRDGTWVYYSLHPELPDWVQDIIQHNLSALSQHTPFQEDLARTPKSCQSE